MKNTMIQYFDQLKGTVLRGILLYSCMMIVLFLSRYSVAGELDQCFSDMMQKASDSTTIGDIRRHCEKRMAGVQNDGSDVIGERLEQDKKNVLKPFTIMAHKPNYFLFGAYNAEGYDSTIYQERYDDQSLELQDIETQFQVSVKVPLLIDLFGNLDVYGAYTNRSFWQLYEVDSSPFRESNHEPEIWVQHNSNWNFLGFKNSANVLGFVHQSNGRGGDISRSWNRIFANFLFERGNFALSFRPYYRIEEDASSDDNPDITDYLGHYELRVGYKYKEHVFSAMSRNNLESGFDRGAVELSWSFPLWDYPFLKGYVQYFYGYGESLIDYDNRVNKIGLGISLSDWL